MMSEPTTPASPESWHLRRDRLRFRTTPLLMGIVNVTPDSFSDGGRYATTDLAVARAMELVEEGADVLDVGGESTRPYSQAVDVQEERRRVEPVVRAICQKTSVPVSVDTSKALVAAAALDQGAQIINDVTGLEGDPTMLPLAVRCEAGVCVMHMQGTPATMQVAPHYDDVVSEIHAYLEQRRDHLLHAGVMLERICVDPGIGFGKTHAHNLQLLSQCYRFLDLGCPLLVGHSRKGFIAHVLHDQQADRLAGTVGVALSLATQGVQILRVHDVAAVRGALQLFAATGGLADRPPLT